jgi:hypothetical protein
VTQPLRSDITIRLWKFCSAKVCVSMESNRATWQPRSYSPMFPLPFDIDNWTLMRCPPLSSVPPKRKVKKKYSQSAPMYPGAIGQLLDAGGIVLSLNAFLRSPLPHPACRTHLKAQRHLRLTERLKACHACMLAKGAKPQFSQLRS